MAQCLLCSNEDPSKAGCGGVWLLSPGNNDEMRSEDGGESLNAHGSL